MSRDAAKTDKQAAPAEKPVTGKKALPTNCQQCNKRIRRKNWYYRNGRYFCGDKCSKTNAEKIAQEKVKAAETAKAAKEAEAAKAKEGSGAAPEATAA